MARFDPARWKDRAKQAAATLRSEYEAGKRGDDTPPAKIWGTPKEQLEAMTRLLRSERAEAAAGSAAAAPSTTTHAGTADSSVVDASPLDDDPEATEVATALRGVDWAAVRAATAERGSEVASAMRSMADHVDWAKVQPVAAQVSSALIAAVASGRIGVGGPLGGQLARTILGQTNLADRVARQIQRDRAPMPPDFRGAIEATSREV